MRGGDTASRIRRIDGVSRPEEEALEARETADSLVPGLPDLKHTTLLNSKKTHNTRFL
jgi:hypothetical protein